MYYSYLWQQEQEVLRWERRLLHPELRLLSSTGSDLREIN